jgi:hypothetical protein
MLDSYDITLNFISPLICSNIIDIYKKNNSLTHSWRDTFPVSIDKLPLPEKAFLENIKLSIEFKIKKKFLIQNISNYEIVRWPPGSHMSAHVDTGDVCGFFLYLNDDFKGGETILYPNTIILPEQGKLFFFDNGKILHQVNKVHNADRYVLAGWYN